MTRFAVWAPAARAVDLVSGTDRFRLAAGADGYHAAEVAAIGPGADYAFSIDGGPSLPDPRSNWQPDGVHGPSRVVDHNSFPWTDQSWQPGPLAAQVLYELHVGTFTPEGTFAGVADRLAHLRDLGVTAIELMPVAEFAGRRGWGYDGVDLYAPHHIYGGPHGLKTLVDRCHAEGLAVIVDVVYNHLGPEGNYLPCFGPYFTDRYRTPWGSALNYDGPDSGPVRDFVIANALMWLRDYHVDGLRLDAVHAIVDISAVHILEELGARVAALGVELGRELWVIAESDLNDPRLLRSTAAGGYGLDASWNDDFHHALHAVLTGERDGYYQDFGTIGDLARAYEAAYVYAGQWSASRRRRHGRPATGLSGCHFVVSAQNHDQIGNRARGERSSQLLDTAGLKIAAALVLAAPFLPLVFQGEEWAASSPFLYFTDLPGELGRAVSGGRRQEFAAFGRDPAAIPDPQDEATYAASKLTWDELAQARHAELLAWHRQLIAWRRRQSGLASRPLGEVSAEWSEDRRWLAVAVAPGTVLAVNLADVAQDVPVVGLGGLGRPVVTLASAAGAAVREGSVALPPRAAAVVTERDKT